MSINLHKETIRRGFGEQVRRDKLASLQMEEVELIVRVKFKASNYNHARGMLSTSLDHHPNLKEMQIIDGVVDKSKLDDLRDYYETILQQREDDLTIWDNALADSGEKIEYWTRKQMAGHHKVTPATVCRWLHRHPIPEESKNGGQYQIPANLARSYQPLKFKVGRKRKDE